MKNVIELAKDNGASAQDLAQALLEYTAKLPSVAEVAFQANALTAQQVLDVFLLQSKESLSFRSACEKLGVWSEAVQTAVKAQAEKGNAALGAFLQSRSLLTTEQIASYQAGEPVATTVAPAVSAAQPAPITLVVSAEITLTTDERRILNDLLADDAKQKILSALEAIEKGEAVAEQFAAIYQVIHETKGILRFIDLQAIEPTVDKAEQITETLSASVSVEPQALSDITGALYDFTNAIWNLKKDGVVWSDAAISQRLDQAQTHVASKKEAA